MKKNTFMRLASVLLVLTLLTTCGISGTFAKYVTTGEGTDSARVAKWGIVFDNTGASTFSDTYDTDVATSVTNENVVAPDTSGSATYQMTGTPETSYQVTMKLDNTDDTVMKDIFLAKGNYTYAAAEGYVGMDVVEADFVSNNDYLTDDKYLPIKYTVTLTSTAGKINQSPNGAYRTLEAVNTALAAVTVDFAPNETCDVVLTISWEWAFEGQNDKMDTVLGDIIAQNADLTQSVTTSSTNIVYKVVMTATQINA